MLTDNITELRRVIHEMTLTYEACRKSETFYMGQFWHDCGGPACICGHAQAELGMEKDRDFIRVSKRFHLPLRWGDWLFVAFGRSLPLAHKPWHSHGKGKARDQWCLAAFARVIDYRRRQLATLLAEQEHHVGRNGPYTTNRRWNQIAPRLAPQPLIG